MASLPPRTPPADVLRALRREVHFGCPVEGCGKPFLMWHHFDPQWSECPHHNPEGMIALCTEHCQEADRKLRTKEDLKRLKRSPFTKDVVEAKLPWASDNLILRVGGSYFSTPCQVLSICDQPIVAVRRSDEGPLLVSVRFYDENDIPVAILEDNFFTSITDISDIVVSPGKDRLEVTYKPRHLYFRLKYSPIAPHRFEQIVLKDNERSRVNWQADIKKRMKEDPEHADWWRSILSREESPSPGRLASSITTFANAHCKNTDGNIVCCSVEGRFLYRAMSIQIQGNRIGVRGRGQIQLSFCFVQNGRGISIKKDGSITI